MRVALFTDCFCPVINGVVTATKNLVNGLAAKGHKVFLVTPYHGAGCIYEHVNVRHFACRGLPAFFSADFKTTSPLHIPLLKAMKSFNPDLFHLQTPWTIGLQAVMMSRLYRKPLVGTFHTFFSDPDYLKNVRMDNRWAAGAADKICILFYNNCDLVSAPSTSALSKLDKLGIKGSLVYISNGLDGSVFDNKKAAQFRRRYVDDKTLLFLYVGRIAPEKNILFLLNAFRDALKTSSRCKLLLVGDGPDRRQVQRYVTSEGLSESVIMVGCIPHEELVVSGIFGAADVFITASKTENQPMTVLEAQANGLPVLGLRARGMPDLISDNENGLLAPVDDLQAFTATINRMACEKGLLERLKKGSLEKVQSHTLGSVIEKWEEVYEAAINDYQIRKVC